MSLSRLEASAARHGVVQPPKPEEEPAPVELPSMRALYADFLKGASSCLESDGDVHGAIPSAKACQGFAAALYKVSQIATDERKRGPDAEAAELAARHAALPAEVKTLVSLLVECAEGLSAEEARVHASLSEGFELCAKAVQQQVTDALSALEKECVGTARAAGDDAQSYLRWFAFYSRELDQRVKDHFSDVERLRTLLKDDGFFSEPYAERTARGSHVFVLRLLEAVKDRERPRPRHTESDFAERDALHRLRLEFLQLSEDRAAECARRGDGGAAALVAILADYDAKEAELSGRIDDQLSKIEAFARRRPPKEEGPCHGGAGVLCDEWRARLAHALRTSEALVAEEATMRRASAVVKDAAKLDAAHQTASFRELLLKEVQGSVSDKIEALLKATDAAASDFAKIKAQYGGQSAMLQRSLERMAERNGTAASTAKAYVKRIALASDKARSKRALDSTKAHAATLAAFLRELASKVSRTDAAMRSALD